MTGGFDPAHNNSTLVSIKGMAVVNCIYCVVPVEYFAQYFNFRVCNVVDVVSTTYIGMLVQAFLTTAYYPGVSAKHTQQDGIIKNNKLSSSGVYLNRTSHPMKSLDHLVHRLEKDFTKQQLTPPISCRYACPMVFDTEVGSYYDLDQ